MEQEFRTHISSEHHLFDLHLKETFQYRDLIGLFVKRDFVAVYKQTILGPAWALIQPMLTTLVFSVIFGALAGLSTADIEGDYIIPGLLFYMSGTVCWNYFAGTLTGTSGTFLANADVMGKVYYPRFVMPVSTALSRLVTFGIQFSMVAVCWLYYVIKGGTSIVITPMLLMIPVCILQMALLGIGFGTIISSVTTKYRDLQMLVNFGMQLWQYASPVAYGLTLMSASPIFAPFMGVFMLNPMTIILTTFRYALFGFGYFDMKYYLVSWGITLFVFLLGLILFSRIERTFMDTI